MSELARIKNSEAQACQTFIDAFSAAKNGRSAVATAVVDRFIERMGGADAFGEVLAANYNRSRGIGLTEEELVEFKPRPQVVQRYDQMYLQGLQKNDEFNRQASPYEGLTVDEVRAEAKETLLFLLRNDDEFRREAMEAISADDELFRKLIGANDVLEVPSES